MLENANSRFRQLQEVKNKFFTSQSQEWRILASLVTGSGILLIQSLLHAERPDLLLLFLEPAIALAFSIVFFVPIWNKLRLQHEGDLIQVRYDGPGATVLKHFRNLLLAWIVLPLLIALQLIALPSLGWDQETSNYAVGAVVGLSILLIAFGYNFDRMIQLEFTVAIATVICTATHCIFSEPESYAPLHRMAWNQFNFSLVAPPLLFFWWFSGLVDMPDMRAQKILQLKRTSWLRLKILLPYTLLFLIQSTYLWKPLRTEQWTFIPIIIVLQLNVLVVVNSHLHWSASLQSQTSIKLNGAFMRGSVSNIKWSQFITLFIAIALLLSGTTFQNILSSIFFLSAGVGPIYILRWIWYRINAWTQLTSMIGAVLFSIIVSAQFPDFNYYTQLAIAGMINMVAAILVMISTQNEASNQKAKLFIQRVTVQNPFARTKNWISFIGLSTFFILVLFSMRLLILG